MSQENPGNALSAVIKTWKKKDGLPIIDYSNQAPNALRGSHCQNIDMNKFQTFFRKTREYDFDLMLEIKDKEKSALKVRKKMNTSSLA